VKCEFPGEECELRAVSWLISQSANIRIPVCVIHREKVKAHLVAMKQGERMPNGPMHPRVVEARAMLNAHTNGCATCRPVVAELSRRMAMIGDVPTAEQTAAFGHFITATACKIGVRLYGRLGRAMLAMREVVES
jgi:hypothetical protein